MRLPLMLLTSAMTIAACTAMSDPKPDKATSVIPAQATDRPPGAPQGSCDAGKVQDHVGETLTPAGAAKILAESGGMTVRVIAPGSAVTMDYRADRLNIEHDAQLKIVVIRCG